MKKIIFFIFGTLFILIAFVNFSDLLLNEEINDKEKEGSLNKNKNSEITLKEEMTVMTLGEPLVDERLRTIHIDKEVIENEYFLILDEEAFLKKENSELIKKMLNENKFFGVYGYKMDVEELFREHPKYYFPFYSIDSSEEIFYYFYGFGYSKTEDRPVPVTLAGNFKKEEFHKNVVDFLIHYKNENGL